MNLIATYPNDQYGIEARVYHDDRGYNVELVDTDADARVVMYLRHNTLAEAVVKAKHLIGESK